MQITRRFNGRAYVDVSVIQYSAYDAWGILPVETNRSFGGFQPEITLPPTSPFKGFTGIRRVLSLVRVMGAVWKGQKSLSQILDEAEQKAKAFISRDFEALSSRALMDL